MDKEEIVEVKERFIAEQRYKKKTFVIAEHLYLIKQRNIVNEILKHISKFNTYKQIKEYLSDLKKTLESRTNRSIIRNSKIELILIDKNAMINFKQDIEEKLADIRNIFESK